MSNESEGVVPSELAHSRQRACMSCSMIKTTAQFVKYGCDNCPFMGYEDDRERVAACTTPSFTGCYVLLKPKESWVAKWQRVALLVPGAYAISVDAKMPEDIYEQLLENDLRPHRVLATAPRLDSER